jgi:hypothetical protein
MKSFSIDREQWREILQYMNDADKRGESLAARHFEERFNLKQKTSQYLQFIFRNRQHVLTHSNRNIKYRILLNGDFHCGHNVGLTPPEYHYNLDRPGKEAYAKFQRETYWWYYNRINSLKPFYAAVYNGDLIDGRGERSGSTELVETDRFLQCDMAVKLIRLAGAPRNYLTYGTPYHTGQIEDFERKIASDVRGYIDSEVNFEIDGVVFNIKHQTTGSSVPHGNATAPLKSALWTDAWADMDDRPRANYVVRSHAHTHVVVGDHRRMVVVLPALQGAGSKFGTRRCEKIVHFGLCYVDIYHDGTHKLFSEIYTPDASKSKLLQAAEFQPLDIPVELLPGELAEEDAGNNLSFNGMD